MRSCGWVFAAGVDWDSGEELAPVVCCATRLAGADSAAAWEGIHEDANNRVPDSNKSLFTLLPFGKVSNPRGMYSINLAGVCLTLLERASKCQQATARDAEKRKPAARPAVTDSAKPA